MAEKRSIDERGIVEKSAKGPRFPVLPPALDERQQVLFDRVSAGPRGGVRGPVALWLYSPGLAEHAQAMGEYLRFHSVFPSRLLELIVLVVAQHFDCAYEWVAHAPLARRAGIPEQVIADVAAAKTPEFDDDNQRLTYDYVRQLLSSHRVDDETFAAFRKAFGERGVIEAASITGYYSLAALVLNVVEVPATTDGRAIS